MKIGYITSFNPYIYTRPLYFKKELGMPIYRLRTFIGYYINPNKTFTPPQSKPAENSKPSTTKFFKTVKVYPCTRIDGGSLTDVILNETLFLPYIKKINNNVLIFLNTPGALAGKLAGRRVVVDLMDFWSCRDDVVMLNPLDYYVLRRADLVFAWSKAITAILRARGVRAEYLPFGVDLKVFDPLRVSPKRFFEKYPELEGRVLVGYSGGMWFVNGVERIGVEKILHAFKKAEERNRELALAIQTSPKVIEMARRIGVKNFVYIPQTKALDLFRQSFLRASDIRVLTSTSFPSVYFAERSTMFQYMASGGAILAERTPGAAGVLKHGENAYFVPLDDVDKMADAILLLAEDKGLRQKLGQNARNLAESQYTVDQIMKKAKTLLEKFI